MQNARLRMGRLEYVKEPSNAKSAPTHITLWMDRAIVQPGQESESPACHLISVFGGEQEISAISAAISEEARFTISGPDLSPQTVSLGRKATIFRGSVMVSERRHPVKHLVAVSEELMQTQAGQNPAASHTVVYDADPPFVAYRIGVRFGVPMLPEWSTWIANELRRRTLVRPLVGVGCSPVLIQADKQLLLKLISAGVKTRKIAIPDNSATSCWDVRRSITA